MKETRFIGQNKEKWKEAEHVLAQTDKDPEKLSSLFVQVVDDLSFSRTYYPYRSVRVYLNKIARQYFGIIYENQKEKTNRFAYFWKEELPQIIIFSKKELLISLVVFLLAFGIGIFSSVQDPEFPRQILGDQYVNMTIANIKNGDPMAVYKSSGEIEMFLQITLNNLMVAFRTYVFGVFMSIGTILILLYNGIMVGCFQYFFIERNLFAESALTIWLHGTLEISSIVLAGGAGLVLGSGLVFPGTYSRLQAFHLSAIRSLKLMLGITPVFVMAALIESFLTRYTQAPDIVRLALILLSASFIIGYFIVYPWWKNKKGWAKPLQDKKLDADNEAPLVYNTIKHNGDIIKDAFVLYSKYFTPIARTVVIVSVLVTAAKFYTEPDAATMRFYMEWWQYLATDLFSFLKTSSWEYLIINAFAITIVAYTTLHVVKTDFTKVPASRFHFKEWTLVFLTSTILIGLLYLLEGFGVLIFIAGYLLLFMLMYSFFLCNARPGKAIDETFTVVKTNFGQWFGLAIVLILLCLSFFLILLSPLTYLLTEFLNFNVGPDDKWIDNIISLIEIFIKTSVFLFAMPLVLMAASLLLHSGLEVSRAETLADKIIQFKNRYTKN
ncbi:MAG: stage II sporulation protein M [Cyclobacteriaceae bacterium]|jgi:uncharacterized membrane protein SpoIIM required for sporulation|nr:stage II sporulation protein M [Cyclobacteriaceae bacterium]